MKVYKHNRQTVYHDSLDCPNIGSEPKEKELALIQDHYDPCSICVEGKRPKSNQAGYEILANKLDGMDPEEIGL